MQLVDFCVVLKFRTLYNQIVVARSHYNKKTVITRSHTMTFLSLGQAPSCSINSFPKPTYPSIVQIYGTFIEIYVSTVSISCYYPSFSGVRLDNV